MRRKLPLTALLLAGCGGFNLTPDAIHCGTHLASGMDVWVDGLEVTYAVAYTIPALTCEQAFLTIDQALTIGDFNGFWEKKDETYGFLGGMRVEFVNQPLLREEGFAGAIGITTDYLGTKEMAVSYAYDLSADYNMVFAPTTDVLATATWPSAVILVHEMTHALQDSGFMNLGSLNGETSSGGHCNWSKSYAPRYANL